MLVGIRKGMDAGQEKGQAAEGTSPVCDVHTVPALSKRPEVCLGERRLGGASRSQGGPRETEVRDHRLPPHPSLPSATRAGAGFNFPSLSRQAPSASTRARSPEPGDVGLQRVSWAISGWRCEHIAQGGFHLRMAGDGVGEWGPLHLGELGTIIPSPEFLSRSGESV